MTRMNEAKHRGQGIVLGPGEGRVLPGPEGITLKATTDETRGSIGLFEATSAPGFGPPRHIHYANDELFYVLEGEWAFLLGDEVMNVSAGGFVFVPRGMVHAPKVISAQPGKVVSAFVPGGPELSFEQFSGLDLEDMEQVQAIAERFDSKFVGPPL